MNVFSSLLVSSRITEGESPAAQTRRLIRREVVLLRKEPISSSGIRADTGLAVGGLWIGLLWSPCAGGDRRAPLLCTRFRTKHRRPAVGTS